MTSGAPPKPGRYIPNSNARRRRPIVRVSSRVGIRCTIEMMSVARPPNGFGNVLIMRDATRIIAPELIDARGLAIR
jgi:hypothetical protein